MRFTLYDKDSNYIEHFLDNDDAYNASQSIEGSYVITEFPCKHCKEYKQDVKARHDYFGIYTGNYCDEDFANNYPYRKDDYTGGTGITDEGINMNLNT